MKAIAKVISMMLVVILAFTALPAGSALAQAPADALGPLTSAVTLVPNPAPASTPVVITALVDDSTTGGAVIKSAEYSLDKTTWTPMTAADGALDTATESVTATFKPAVSGVLEVCVRGTDALDNMGEPVCAALTVQYAFKGFFSPIRMGKENKANAGRTIPVKWQLKTADGKPVSDKNSFVAVKTYPVDCVTLTGDPAATTVEKFPGKSGLRYQGSGKWMFNWKTDKAYKATCRMMFVEFTGGQKSPEVLFRFK